jgi:hypothetical protein
MKGCMDHINLVVKVSKPRITLAYRLLVAAPATMTNQSNVEGTNDLTNSSRGSGTPPWLHHSGTTMAARAWPKPSPKQLEDLRRPLASSRCFSFMSAAL